MQVGLILVYHYSQSVVLWGHRFTKVFFLVRSWKFCLVLSLSATIVVFKVSTPLKGKATQTLGIFLLALALQNLTKLVALRCLQIYTYNSPSATHFVIVVRGNAGQNYPVSPWHILNNELQNIPPAHSALPP